MAMTTFQVQRKVFSVDEYDQMVRAGVLGEDDRLELIEGEIVEMSPIGGLHIQVVNRLTNLLAPRLAGRAIVSVQNPIRLPDSEPQPDVTVLKVEVDQRLAGVPRADEVLLLVEVADTTAAYDRTVKVPIYARSGIIETWLIDLQERAIEVYRRPASTGYHTKQTLGLGDHVSPEALPEVRLAVAEIIPA